MITRLTLAAVAAALVGTGTAAMAAEGGAGFYLLGTRTIDAGIVAPPGTYVQTSLYAFSGSTSKTVPVGGELDLGLDAKAAIGFVTGLWAPATEIAGGRPYVLVLVPYGWKQADITATLAVPNGPDLTGERTQDGTAFGDPAVGGGIGWGSGPWFASANLLVNIPAGPYDEGSATNISFHRWAADLTGAFTYLWPQAWQGNLAVGMTWNGENPATDYTTGDELHLEAALAKGFGGWTLGLAGYHYQQVTGDSGRAPSSATTRAAPPASARPPPGPAPGAGSRWSSAAAGSTSSTSRTGCPATSCSST